MKPNNSLITLNDFILNDLKKYPNATGTFSNLLRDISFIGKRLHVEVNHAGIADILSLTGNINVQGEEVHRLDEFANKLFIQTLLNGGACAGIGSEEEKEIIVFDEEVNNQSPYIVLFDPIDGSGNIDVNVSIGSIFSIYKRKSLIGQKASKEDFLQAGNKIIAAGYILYGSSTILVYATQKNGVNGFTLDTSIGEFCLSHRNITTPKVGKIFSVNTGNFAQFPEGIQKYISQCQGNTANKECNYSLRYVSCMIADIHRNLLQGGVFLYPPTIKKPNGKLRLMYESNPMGFIVEAAGGIASNGTQKILDITPNDVHQRTPLYIGSYDMVNEILQYIK